MYWREHILADTVPLFQPFYSFPKNWVKTGVLVCPVYALYEFTVLANSIRILYFHVCFRLSSLCLQLLRHGSYLSFAQVSSFHTCTIMSPFLWNADFSFFKRLPSPSRSRRMPKLALIVQQTLPFLSGNGWSNLTLLQKLSWYVWGKMVRKLWGQWTSRRSQLFTWTSCGGITVTVQTFIVTIIRDIRTYIHIYLTQNIVLLQNIPMQSYDCNWRKKSIWMSGLFVVVL
jgi:hypothetical protein